ncbi:LysR family transcriptional regulator [Ottowia sp. VDI28]|uniref:LysR family transcriptional regulator n=1 Tax=Ottowia sp. VDI28 TaxID=3133968 RepID=UPI003C2F8920
MRNLNILNLETACWVARLGSFTAAAERMYATQPAISARVRELESALGTKVFVRGGRGVELTMQGRELIRHAEPLLQQLEVLAQSLNQSGAMSGVVRIGAGNICMGWFPALMNELKRRMPRVTYDVEIERAAKLLDKLDARKLDLAIVSGPVDGHKFHAVSLGHDRMVWLATPALLQAAEPLDLEAFLNSTPLWCVQRDSFFWSEAMQALTVHGATLENLNGINNMAAAKDMVLGHAGVGLLSETLAQEELARGQLVPVPGLQPSAPVESSIVRARDDTQQILEEVMHVAAEVSTFRKNT